MTELKYLTFLTANTVVRPNANNDAEMVSKIGCLIAAAMKKIV